MILPTTLAGLAAVSFALTLWQWLVARRFPLHERSSNLQIGSGISSPASRNEPNRSSALPPVTLFKPLKGADEHTKACLRSWFKQDYPGEVQILLGVEAANDPAVQIVNELLAEFADCDAQLVLCPESIGANAKVAKLAQLEPLAKHELIVVSDADVRVPPDLLANVLSPLANQANLADNPVGLVNCFYRLAQPTTPAMRWEAIAINADFWSQVLQSQSLKPLDFALGAAVATRRKLLAEIGGFRSLADCIADDFQLGRRLSQRGYRIELCPVVAECWSAPMNWRQVWRHQLRWARTIRVCEPLPYFLSILSNATLWPLLWLLSTSPWLTHTAAHNSGGVMVAIVDFSLPVLAATFFLLCRVLMALDLQSRLTQSPRRFRDFWLVPLKDLLQVVIWTAAFLGNRVEWRGDCYRLRRDGTMKKL